MDENRNEIRERVAGIMKYLRIKKRMTEQEAAGKIGISTKTIERIEHGQISSAIENIVLLMSIYNGTLDDIIKFFDINIGGDGDLAYDLTTVHTNRLRQYIDMKYTCYYISKTGCKPDSLSIWTKFKTNNGYLPATSKRDGYYYTVKIISPSDYDYTFFYLTSKGTIANKAIIIMPYLREIKRSFLIGVGVMLSFSVERPSFLCYQKVIMISDTHPINAQSVLSVAESLGYLKLFETNCRETCYTIKTNNLAQETKTLYSRCKKNH